MLVVKHVAATQRQASLWHGLTRCWRQDLLFYSLRTENFPYFHVHCKFAYILSVFVISHPISPACVFSLEFPSNNAA